jgi:hypothetical protein
VRAGGRSAREEDAQPLYLLPLEASIYPEPYPQQKDEAPAEVKKQRIKVI